MTPVSKGIAIGGIPVRVHWSVLVILALFTESLAVSLLPDTAAGYSTAVYWATAAACGVGFMACLLGHELAHALVAKHLGLHPQRITLWLLGGIARLGEEARTARGDLAVAVVGPAASAVLSLLFWLASLVARAQGAGRLAVVALVWLAWANGVVAAFNLLPGAPLDGGRVLRALLWWRSGDRERAAAAAERAGSVLGTVLMVLGGVAIFLGDLAGLWFVLLGMFMAAAARGEREAHQFARIDFTAADVMTPDPVCAPSWYTLSAFLAWAGDHGPQRAYPVVDFNGYPAGVVVLADLARMPDLAENGRVADVAWPLSRVAVLAPDAPAVEVLTASGTRTATGGRRGAAADAPALVVDAGKLVGVVETERLLAAVQLAALHRRMAHA